MNQQIRQLMEKITGWWSKYDARQKRNLIIIGALALAILAMSSWFLLRTTYVVAFTNQDAKSAGEIVNKLTALKIPYKTEGGNILVPSQDADQVKMQMALAGLPKSGYITYQDIFNANNLGMTQGQFDLQKLAALEGSLSQTIQSINGIDGAEVHIVMPQQHLFVDQAVQDAKASVLINEAPGTQLIPAQVSGIQQLVAHAVQGLKASNVSVVDQNGVRLNSMDEGSLQNSASTDVVRELQIKNQVEDSMAERIRAGLEHMFGNGNVTVNVNADINFDQVTTQSHTVQPVGNGNTGIVVSEQSSTTSSTGTPATGGVPGPPSTVPGSNVTTTAGAGNASSNYNQKSNTTNYDYNKVDTTTKQDPFKINKYTVSVLVNANLTPQSMQQIKDYIATSIGAQNNGSKNADITVASAKFQVPVNPFTGTKSIWYQNPYVIGGGLLGLALAAGGGFLLARRRKQGDSASEFDMEPILPDAPVIEETAQQKLRKDLDSFASKNPEEFANLLRTWLVED
ncbi:flagellar M-ring protein FliF [Fodinisporobacter ferrooxydans]|uniref:Flagellar M-ring protein n=1 Tax=Fodinisporobacter ferrooxydans TaxID=2901836 RepID=A0ABY4CGD7_9BACL|nr:flagellar M-ring protein FliF [Alicyclobacillaceae bacterium MYW30-H2]